MKEHELKTWAEPFQAIWDGLKLYEVRKDDRSYVVGDRLRLREYVLSENRYTGRVILADITYKTQGGTWELLKNICVLGIRVMERIPNSWMPS